MAGRDDDQQELVELPEDDLAEEEEYMDSSSNEGSEGGASDVEEEEHAGSGDDEEGGGDEDQAGPSQPVAKEKKKKSRLTKAGGGKKEKKKRSAFIDDAAEEDEDDRRLKRSRFIDDIAEVDDDDEDDDEDGEGGLDDLIDDAGEQPDHNDVMEVRRAMREAELQAAKDDELNPEELEKYLKERFGRERVAAYAADDGDIASGVTQQALMPTARDPKLWVVRCIENAEKEIVVCILQKCYDYAAKGKPLLIKSAFCKDQLKGYFYVEAYKETHVRDALKGLRNIFHSKAPKIVPLGEMIDAITENKPTTRAIQPGAWVRMRAGLYKNDLAKVTDVDPNTGKATVKLVPRIDYAAMANRRPEDTKNNFGKQPKVRPAPRAFSAEEAKAHRLDVSQQRDRATGEMIFVLNNNNRFHQGYLLKTMAVKSLVLQSELPPLDELQRYQAALQDDRAGAADANDLASVIQTLQSGDGLDADASALAKFSVGDKVLVVDGDLRNMTGKVELVTEAGNIMVRLSDPSIKDLIAHRPRDLAKHFDGGDHVKVVHGQHEGETGMVLSVENSIARVFTDSTKQELQVFCKDLVESAAIASSIDTIGDYELFDLVALDSNTAGVIVGVEKDSCQVLTNQGRPDKPDIRVCRLPDLKRKIDSRRSSAFDGLRQEVKVGDIVEVSENPLKGRSGTIKHIMRGYLFIQSREVLENGGFYVLQAKQCRARGDRGNLRAGGASASILATPGPGPSPYPYNGGPGGAAGGVRTMGAQQQFTGRVTTSNDRALIGTTKEIIGGPFRGLRGRITAATPTHVRMELEAQMKTVNVERRHIPGGFGPGGNAPAAMRTGAGYGAMPGATGRTPAHPSQYGPTPAHWSQLPTATPFHPSTTPGRGDVGKTPAYDPAWAATPAHPGFGGNDHHHAGTSGSFLNAMPGMMPGSAAGSYLPSQGAPGMYAATPMAPTPMANEYSNQGSRGGEGDYTHQLWTGLEVAFSDGGVGTLVSVDASGGATVADGHGAHRIVPFMSLKLAPVAKGDVVRVVLMGGDVGLEGEVVTIGGDTVVVKLNAGGRVAMLKPGQVGRIV